MTNEDFNNEKIILAQLGEAVIEAYENGEGEYPFEN